MIEIGKISQIGQTEPKAYVYTSMVKFVQSKAIHKREKHLKKMLFYHKIFILFGLRFPTYNIPCPFAVWVITLIEIGKISQIGQTEPKAYVYTSMVKFVQSKATHKREKHLKKMLFYHKVLILPV